MERTQYDWQHDYIATPQEFNISANGSSENAAI